MSGLTNLIREAQATPIDEAIKELAKLKIHEYQTVREKAAKQLGLKLVALDESVKEMKAEQKNDNAVNNESYFDEVEPYDGVVDTNSLLNEIREVVNDYLFLPPHADVVLTLWIAHAHVFHCFRYSPRLIITSTDPECGKSMVLDVLEQLVPKPALISHTRAAAFCRFVEKYRPTLLLDEYDTYMKKDDDLRGIINAGQKFNGKHMKCVGDNYEPTFFACFCPVALAGIGKLHSTVMSRSHIIKMKPAKPFEIKKDFDHDELDRERLINSKLVRWALGNEERLKKSKPKLHEALKNRKKDSWRPFYAIAEDAGFEWINLANLAVDAMYKGRSLSFKEKLLDDIRNIFESDGLEEILSKDLTEILNELEFRGYADMNEGRGVTQNLVASMLSGYGIRPKQLDIYIDGKRTQRRGYKKEMFEDAWSRHLDRDVEDETQIDTSNTEDATSSLRRSPVQTVTPSHVNTDAGFRPNQSVTGETDVTPENARKANGSNGCDTVTAVTANQGGMSERPLQQNNDGSTITPCKEEVATTDPWLEKYYRAKAAMRMKVQQLTKLKGDI